MRFSSSGTALVMLPWQRQMLARCLKACAPQVPALESGVTFRAARTRDWNVSGCVTLDGVFELFFSAEQSPTRPPRMLIALVDEQGISIWSRSVLADPVLHVRRWLSRSAETPPDETELSFQRAIVVALEQAILGELRRGGAQAPTDGIVRSARHRHQS